MLVTDLRANQKCLLEKTSQLVQLLSTFKQINRPSNPMILTREIILKKSTVICSHVFTKKTEAQPKALERIQASSNFTSNLTTILSNHQQNNS